MKHELSMEELEYEKAECLPERDVMAVINVATLLASNAATAANVLTDDSAAIALGAQESFVFQF